MSSAFVLKMCQVAIFETKKKTQKENLIFFQKARMLNKFSFLFGLTADRYKTIKMKATKDKRLYFLPTQ